MNYTRKSFYKFLFSAVLFCLLFLVGCKDDAFSEHALVEVSFTEEGEETGDGSRGLVPDYYGRGSVRLVRNYEPNDLFWLYTAEHKYNVSTGHQSSVYATGETPRDASGNLIKQPVSPDGGYGFADYRKVLSAGDWEIKLYGYDSSNQAGCTDAKLVYTSTKTVTVAESTSLQKVPFTLTLDSDYSKRYLFVTGFDATFRNLNTLTMYSSTTGYFDIRLTAIANTCDGISILANSITGMPCKTKVTALTQGMKLHFEDLPNKCEITSSYVDTNGCLHFFAALNETSSNWLYDISDALVVPTKLGYTTYVDGKIFKFDAYKPVGGTLFYTNTSVTNKCLYIFWTRNTSNGWSWNTAPSNGTDCSNRYYWYHDYNGTGHVDKYYVWNENLISGTIRWLSNGNATYDDGSVPAPDGKSFASYSIGGVSYNYDGREAYTSTAIGSGRSRTNYWINIYRKNDTSSTSSLYYKNFWEGTYAIGPYIRNIRATKQNGCDDWYVPSIGELAKLCSDSGRVSVIKAHCREGWSSSSKTDYRVFSSSNSSGTTLTFFWCTYNLYTSNAPGHTPGDYNGNVVPIRSF